MCGSVNYPSSLCSTKQKTTQSPLYKEFLTRAKAEVAKANPKVPRCQTECQGPNLPHQEAPTMELHLVIVSKVYFSCLFQSICPS